MSRQKELVKNTIILTIGKICTQFVSFLLLPLYTALLQPEEFGIVDLFNTYIALLVPVFGMQLDNGLFRFLIDCRDDKYKQKRVFSSVFVLSVLQSAIYLLFFFVANRFINSEYKIFLAIDVVLNIFLNLLLQFPRGLGKNEIYAIGSFISAALTVVFNVILIAVLSMGAYGMFWATVIAKVITVFYLIVANKIWQFIDIRQCDRRCIKEISRYSLPLVPNQLAWWVINASDRTIVSKFLGVAINGIYSVANKFSTIYITFYNVFNLSWSESVSLHINDDDAESFLEDIINTMFNLFACVCMGIIVVMPFVFSIFINEKYGAAYNQIPILMLAVLFQVVVGLYSVIYVALKKSVEIAKTSFYAGIINILVDILLIKFIGLYAASFSTLVAFATMAIYRYFHVRRYLKINLKSRVLISTVILMTYSLVSYYINNFIMSIITFWLVLAYSIVVNRKFLKDCITTVYKKIKTFI